MKPSKRWTPPSDETMAKIFPKWKQRSTFAGMKVVVDPTVPRDEVRFLTDAGEVGRIVNLKVG